ncbi:MAG TPA: hypothetical protein VKB88_31275 [Bryobacteraceae bacterium]|nr:hypothetical protein [Bryobacteraceae bacterium]
MDFLFAIFAFTIGTVAGSAINQKDPVSMLLNAVRRRGVGFIVGSLGIGFAVGLLWKMINDSW